MPQFSRVARLMALAQTLFRTRLGRSDLRLGVDDAIDRSALSVQDQVLHGNAVADMDSVLQRAQSRVAEIDHVGPGRKRGLCLNSCAGGNVVPFANQDRVIGQDPCAGDLDWSGSGAAGGGQQDGRRRRIRDSRPRAGIGGCARHAC